VAELRRQLRQCRVSSCVCLCVWFLSVSRVSPSLYPSLPLSLPLSPSLPPSLSLRLSPSLPLPLFVKLTDSGRKPVPRPSLLRTATYGPRRWGFCCLCCCSISSLSHWSRQEANAAKDRIIAAKDRELRAAQVRLILSELLLHLFSLSLSLTGSNRWPALLPLLPRTGSSQTRTVICGSVVHFALSKLRRSHTVCA
jgi:hypothetical protein